MWVYAASSVDEVPYRLRGRATWARRLRHRREWVWGGRVPSPLGEESGEGAMSPPQNFFLLLALKMVSFGAFWVVVLQLSCLFTAYASIMPVCVTDSQTIVRHKKRLNSLSCAFIFTSRRTPAYTLGIRRIYLRILPTTALVALGLPACEPLYRDHFTIVHELQEFSVRAANKHFKYYCNYSSCCNNHVDCGW